MIARLVGLYLAIFAAVLAALSIGAYIFVGTQYHSLLLPALATPEGVAAYQHSMQRVALTIVAFDIPLLIVVGIASWMLARISVAPWVSARAREREFIADAAHELRSPLATIASVAQVSRNEGEAKMRDALELIVKTSLDASGVIADLLTLARSPSTTLLVREPVDLAAITLDCIGEFRTRASAAGITIETQVSSAIINGDARRLRELIRNLLENALHHARATITVLCASRDGCAHLSVSDDGLGVPSESRDRIFERFFRNGEAAGTGLGLSIAQWVARAHEGTISLAEDTPGASFVVEIPLLPS